MTKKQDDQSSDARSDSEPAAEENTTEAASAQTPVSDVKSFPIVGIGASAGGLEAFERLFTNLPPDSGMAFVIVQHLDPTHDSILTDLLNRYTQMPVTQVDDHTQVESNRVYVIRPNTDMTLQEGILFLRAPSMPRGLRLPIDHFFRSMATDLGEKAICIILSGTGTDGTLGMRAIKEEGGLAIVQSPDTARYDGMPLSALNTGLIDLVLPPEKIAEQLIGFVERSYGRVGSQAGSELPTSSQFLQRIYMLLKSHTGHDFSGYKENTTIRRIERRMTVNQVMRPEDYLRFLHRTPLEIDTLFRELLIGVTSFFRDPAAFESLEQKVILPLFAETRVNAGQIRVWVPACSTGEEAYSIAMLLQEHMERSTNPVEFQVFATDIDHGAITKAREGRYPDSIAADVSPERLHRFFTHEKDGNFYQMKRKIRDCVVFAEQSVTKDPPFSKLDLISCRNLMIYLGPQLQQRLLSVFHYALNSGGFLLLGNSESLGEAQKLFHTQDSKWKIFKRAEYITDINTVLQFSGEVRPKIRETGFLADRPLSAKELTEQLLLSNHVPTTILINESGDMLYVHGATGKYLEQSTGEASTNIIQMAREGLRMPLSTAVRSANTKKKEQMVEGIIVRNEGGRFRVKLTVTPVSNAEAAQDLLLVTLSELPDQQIVDVDIESNSAEYTQSQHVVELEQELRSTREYLQTVIEELETTNEELKSSNEELQSANEELQSTNEELQTSKEELQSVNEELVTVNTELQSRVEELTIAHSDIKNLMESTQVGTIFLDNQLRIRRFTESSQQIVDLIPEDIGRPLKNFVHKLKIDNMMEKVREVLHTQTPITLEVQSEDQAWYLLRIMPYRTIDEQIAGLVMTLTDVTLLKQSEARLSAAIAISGAGIYQHRIPLGPELFVSERWATMLGYNKEEIFSNYEEFMSWYAGAMHPDDLPAMQAAYMDFVEGKTEQYEVEVRMKHKLGHWVYVQGLCRAIARDGDGRVTENIGVTLDVTAFRQAEQAIREATQRYTALFQNLPLECALYRLVRNDEGDIVDWELADLNPLGARSIDGEREDLIGTSALELFGAEIMEEYLEISRQVAATGESHQFETYFETNGRYYASSVFLVPPEHYATVSQDVTDRKRAQEELLQTRKLESVGVLAGGIAHDFNNLLLTLSLDIELAKKMIDADSKVQKHLDSASYGIARATGLTTQLLTFAKGGDPLVEMQEVGPVLTNSANFAMMGSKSKLKLEIAPDLWLAEVDLGQIDQVINNLIINARQAMDVGGAITLRAVNVEIDDAPFIQITVHDEGAGIDPDIRQQLFDPYVTTKPGNTGLGLATVHSIVTKHNGRIDVGSEPGEGTTFTLLLPASPDAVLEAPGVLADDSNTDGFASAHILILEDNTDMSRVLQEVLEMMGLQSTVTEIGEAAVAAYEAAMGEGNSYQAVILDLTIPGGMDGKETAEKIAELDPEATLIVSSGYANDPIMAHYKEYGFVARLPKPYQLDYLQSVLSAVLAGEQHRDV